MSIQKVGMSFTLLCLGSTCMVQETDREETDNFENLFTDLTQL